MSSLEMLPPIVGGLGMVIAFVIYMVMVKYPEGGEKLKKIASAIH